MGKLKTEKRQQGLTTAETFTYVLIAIIIPVVIFGFYRTGQLDSAVAAALAIGEEQKVHIEKYFQDQGRMPQSEAEAGLEGAAQEGVLTRLIWRAGAIGEPDSDKLLTGTIQGLVDLSGFGERFEKHKSGYVLIARAQEDGTILWDCGADPQTPDALPPEYLPESCKKANKPEGE